ncbi:TonB-dependent receptor [Sinomicrobium pectinilyticum]|uniref:TonB-dependent receptor n=1 Tax=Sinomicrobium pectinilyticum TaxID=1084421 RepID=A0A3N0EDP1_SINP1|nr:TonB-dependent receptor [Sinomicrobium pectinilyticum]RNL85921.1 TonB-dependent receptor [Sinomicrobium pectinilyticum]
MKFCITYCLLLVSCIMYGQQQASITGKVTNGADEPAAFSNVFINELNRGTSADENGYFRLKNIPPGSYTLTVSEIGFTTQEHNITLEEGQNLDLNFQLQESVTALQTVEVIGRKEKSYKNTTSFVGAKTEIALKDLPQAVSYATKELIADQGVMRVGDIVKNFSGVNQNTFYDDIIIRGYRINGGSNTQLLNGMRTSTGFWKQPLANYLERVEVLKGPSSALFGNASPGGVINRVTKKPLDEVRNSVSFSTGSFNTLRALGDFTGPLTKDKSLLYRLNIGYEDANSFRDLQFDKNLVIAPSISFLPTDKTRVNFDLIYNSSKSRLDRGQSTFKDDLYSTPISQSLSATNDYLNEETYIITIALNHQFTDNLSFSASYIRTGYNEDLLEHRGANQYAVDSLGQPIPDQIAMQVFQRKRKRFIDNLSTFFNYKVRTGALDHNLIAGYDYAQQEIPRGGSQLQANGYLTTDGGAKAYDKNNPQDFLFDSNSNPIPNVAHFDLTDPVASQQLKDMNNYIYTVRSYGPELYNSHGVYIQDQISWDKLKVLVGLRYDYYTDKQNYDMPDEKSVHQEAFLPRIGVTYSVTDNINLYGTYVQGFEPQTASNMDPNLGGPFDPLESNMIEFGGKSSWFNGKLDATLALYRIEQKNTLYAQPGTDVLQQIGKDRSRGVEVDLNGRILPNWSVSASYSFIEAEIVKDAQGNRSGIQKPNTPKHQGNLWTRYNINHGQFKGLGAGFGTNFVTERVLQQNSAQTIPAYTLLNAALYYSINKFTLQLNINNITDKTHWVGGYDYIRLFPGAPRNWLLTVGYSF